MNIYLDIDGVLITKELKPAKHVGEFLEYITGNHSVYWLTTHCRGNSDKALGYLEDKLPEPALQYLKKIEPSSWRTLKTEAIDFGRDFCWIDDYVMQSEFDILEKNKAMDKVLIVDLKENPKVLKQIIEILNKRVK